VHILYIYIYICITAACASARAPQGFPAGCTHKTLSGVAHVHTYIHHDPINRIKPYGILLGGGRGWRVKHTRRAQDLTNRRSGTHTRARASHAQPRHGSILSRNCDGGGGDLCDRIRILYIIIPCCLHPYFVFLFVDLRLLGPRRTPAACRNV